MNMMCPETPRVLFLPLFSLFTKQLISQERFDQLHWNLAELFQAANLKGQTFSSGDLKNIGHKIMY